MLGPLIEFRNVRKRFGAQTVLDGVNLRIPPGATTTIIGKSGVGKSVLLRHIAALLEPDEGEVLYRGLSITHLRGKAKRAFKRTFSYMFQSMALFDSMTVYENIALPLEEKTKLSPKAIRESVMEIVEQLDLRGIPEKYPAQISGGMRKRVALARALITNPDIILFDEPTTGLDPIRRNAVHSMIAQYRQAFGFTAIIVSHDIPEIFAISERVAMLEEGKIVFDGTPEEIVHSSNEVVRNFLQGSGGAD